MAANTTPFSTYKTFLMHGTTSSSTTTYTQLVPIKDFPDLGGAPEQIEVTTLGDKQRRYVPGIEANSQMTFTANYTIDEYEDLVALEGSEEAYAVWLGGTESGGTLTPSGDDGKFAFRGFLSVYVAGGGTNKAQEMKITITRSSEITLES